MRASTVYFVQAEPPAGPVKIGYTARRVQDRLAEGQTFSAEPLRVLVEARGTPQDEAALHRRFAASRAGGGSEWFALTPELQELILYLVDGGDLRTWLE